MKQRVQESAIVVDDDSAVRALTSRWLRNAGLAVQECSSAEGLLQALGSADPDVICLDLGLPGMSGLDVLPQVRKTCPDVPVVVLTGDTSVESIVRAMSAGAFDYVAKPSEQAKLVATVCNAVERRRTSRKIPVSATFENIVGTSPVMRKVFAQISKIAANDVTVLIHGESGTGKELVATAIHHRSTRRAGPFVAVNCAAIPESLQDSELFGHERGAFTGADRMRPGRFEQADRGTLFLDEVGELSLSLQAKLLRVLQERKFERVGGTKPISSNFRLIAATHRDLAAMVRQRTFREDLYFRVAVLDVELPPLRARTEDLAPLIEHLLDKIQQQRAAPKIQLTPAALLEMTRYSWPGNVRELHNVLQRACIVAGDDQIEVDDLPSRLRDEVALDASPGSETAGQSGTQPIPSMFPAMTLEELERWAIERTIAKAGGNMTEVIRRLGIGRTTLYRKLKQYGIK
jgi:DNA-binding NtrC family response regulator